MNQHQESDDPQRWQKWSGMNWPHWLTLKKHQIECQEDAFVNDQSRVREPK